jgi:non-canonical purine NTP pyrophosphatase (RdgB/HAM1 family)
MNIFYVTGNKFKFKKAEETAKNFNLKLIQKSIDIQEIQSDSIEEIAKDKAKKAFRIVKKPLIVSDSGWSIPALNGFPGAYMHYVNNWFTARDFLNLMKNKKDQTIILNSVVCTIINGEIKIFKEKFKGLFIDKVEGEGIASDKVVKMEGSDYTVAKNQNLGKKTFNMAKIWNKVFNWLKNERN